MFLKLATIVAIAGTALHLLLNLFQQMLFRYRPFGSATFDISRAVTLLDLIIFSGALLIFFVAVFFRLQKGPDIAAKPPQ
jgi:TRAP-type C4-dicarboxylate transport system permease small subunit